MHIYPMTQGMIQYILQMLDFVSLIYVFTLGDTSFIILYILIVSVHHCVSVKKLLTSAKY